MLFDVINQREGERCDLVDRRSIGDQPHAEFRAHRQMARDKNIRAAGQDHGRIPEARTPFAGMTLIQYFAEIGLRYLGIFAPTVAVGYVLERRLKGTTNREPLRVAA